MTNELKPCPCCGPKAFIVTATQCDPSIGEHCWTAKLRCHECGLNISRTAATEQEALYEAIEAWNTRAERTCHLERIPYEPGEYEGMRCSVCKTVDLEMGVGPYCPNCGAKVVE